MSISTPALIGVLIFAGPTDRATGLSADVASRPAASAPAPEPTFVYANDFEQPAEEHWIPRRIGTTPAVGNHFLGEYANDTLMLRLMKLPAHTHVRIRLDLYIFRSWDGSIKNDAQGNVLGPDLWSVEIKGGPTLMRASFALFTRDGGRQSFPDDYPFGDHPHLTGAVSSNGLGIRFENMPMDAVYHLDLAAPHDDPNLFVDFQGAGLQHVSDESWGIDNVRIEAFARPPGEHLDDAELRRLVQELMGDDPVKGHAALWALVSAGERAVDALARDVRPSSMDEASVATLIAKLDHHQWKVRQEATERLKSLGAVVGARLRTELTRPISTETRARIEQILEALAHSPAPHPDTARYGRAIRALEVLGSPGAKAVLGEWSGNAPDPVIQEAARAARDRIRP